MLYRGSKKKKKKEQEGDGGGSHLSSRICQLTVAKCGIVKKKRKSSGLEEVQNSGKGEYRRLQSQLQVQIVWKSMKARDQEPKEESDGITLEDFDFSDDKHDVGKREDQDRLVKKAESTSSSLEEFSNNHFVVLDTDANQEVERGRNVDDEDEKNKKKEGDGDEKSAEAGSESESPKSDKSTATDHEHSATKKRKRGGSSLSDEERRKRNTEASARFRIKRRMREQEMSERLTKIRAHIAELKVKEKTLSMENECLKRMLLGDAAVGAMLTSKDASTQPAIDTMSNYQLLNLMRQKSGEGFRITTV